VLTRQVSPALTSVQKTLNARFRIIVSRTLQPWSTSIIRQALALAYRSSLNTASVDSQFGQFPRLSYGDMYESQGRRNLAPILLHQLSLSTDVRWNPERIYPTPLGIMWWSPRTRKEIRRVEEPHDESRDRVLFLGIYRNPVVAVTPWPRSSVRSGVRQAILLLSTVFAAFIVDQLGVCDVELQFKQIRFSSP